jgi:hypothetical protein
VTLFDRIAAKTLVPDDPEDRLSCWEWQGAYSVKRRNRRPHIRVGTPAPRSAFVNPARYVCELIHGAPEPGQEAGHTCPFGENEKCISPWHLRWMTREENERWKRSYYEAA